MKDEAKTNPTDANIKVDEKRSFEGPLFELPQMATPEVLREIAEQSVVRVKENCEKMKTASVEVADVLREIYSTSAKGAADYRTKVMEISSVNTSSAFDFLTDLMATKSLSEIMTLSATQTRKNFDAASVQNKELWDLAQKVATETAEPIKKSVVRVMQKVT